MTKCLLDLRDLRTYFHVRDGVVKAVDGVSFHLNQGQTMGLVGESGCGKSVTALSIMRLVDQPSGKIHSGKILFQGKNLISLTENEMRNVRGHSISIIFQEPMTSLNPILSIGFQISESMKHHLGVTSREAQARVLDLLKMVEISSPEKRIKEYPHQLSGGMRQRVMIAMAIACKPKVLIADEPTTALDVTIQAQILELLKKLQNELGTSILLITHNLGVITEMAQEVAVMYAGRIVEKADISSIFNSPIHPYTRGLLLSIPRISEDDSRRRLREIPGTVPELRCLPMGCSFFERCSEADPRCQKELPELRAARDGHFVRCWKL